MGRELISAELDGEADDTERAALAAHLAICSACTTFRADASRLHRASRVGVAASVPDLTDAILDRVAAEGVAFEPAADLGRAVVRKRRLVYAMQYGLLVVALLMVVLAVPDLLASSGNEVHASRHLGGWDLAFAVGLLLAALQPWRARGLLPMAGALAGVMAVTAAIDIVHGSTPGMAEGTHLLEVLGLAFLWMLARAVPGADRPGRARVDGPSIRSMVAERFGRVGRPGPVASRSVPVVPGPVASGPDTIANDAPNDDRVSRVA